MAAAEKKLSDAKDVSDRLLGPEGIFALIRQTTEKTTAWEREKKNLLEMTDRASSLAASYQSLYQAFIEGQARILTGSLETEVRERGEASCPVCGTRVRSPWRAPSFGGSTPPDRKEVETARRNAERAEKNRSAQAQLVQRLETESLQGQEYAVRGISQIYKKNFTWEMLTEPGRLEYMEKKISDAIRDRTEAFQEASRMVSVKEKTRASLKDNREKLERLRKTREEESTAFADLQAALAGRQAEYKAVRESLTFETEKAALLEDQKLAGEQEKLKAAIDRAEKDLKAAGDALNTIKGR
ncbi:MAG: hypothetical protein ACSW8K_13580, partial [bacterium]